MYYGAVFIGMGLSHLTAAHAEGRVKETGNLAGILLLLVFVTATRNSPLTFLWPCQQTRGGRPGFSSPLVEAPRASELAAATARLSAAVR